MILAALLLIATDPISLHVERADGTWQVLDPPRYNAGYTHAALRFCAEMPADAPVLVVPGNFDSLTFEHATTLTPESPLLARIHAASSDGTVCFTIRSANAINVEPLALSLSGFAAHASMKTYGDGAYYGLMLAVVLFNALAVRSLGDRSRRAYLVYQLGFVCVQLGFDGVWLQVWPGPKPFVQRFELLLLSATVLAALIFTRHFLDVGARRLFRFAFISGLMVIALATVLPLELAFLSIAAGSLVVPTAIIALALPHALRGEPEGMLFAGGFGVFLVTIVATVLTDVGLIPSLLPYDATTKLGSAVEALLLTAALGVQIERMRARKDAAEHARVEALRTLVSGVAHEIGNPLNAAKGAVGELARRAPEGPLAVGVSIAGRGLARIEGTVQALRSALQGGSVPAQRIELTRAIADVVLLTAVQAEAKRVRVESAVIDAAVSAGAGEIEQVLHNLILNAIDASPAEATVRLRCARSGHFMEVSVEDDGPGVPAADRDRIFDAFFTTKPAQAGAGLGLWVSREICRRRGGDLSLDPTTKGGRFVARFLVG